MSVLPQFFYQQFIDANGNPYSGFELHFFEPSTSTPKTVYYESSGADVSYGTSLTLDTWGLPPNGPVRFLGGSCDIYLTVAGEANPIGNPVKTYTNVNSSGGDSGTLDTIADLRGVSPGEFNTVVVVGYYADSDQIDHRVYYWNTTSTDSDDGGTVINPTGNTDPGRWLLSYDKVLNPKWLGAYDDGTNATINDNAISNAITAIGSNGTLLFSEGSYIISSNFTIPTGIELKFEEGAYITAGSALDVVLNGKLSAPLSRIFDTNISLDTSSSTHSLTAYPEWWNAYSDGTNAVINDNAFDKAISAGNHFKLGNPSGSYALTAASNLKSNLEIDLNGATIASNNENIFIFQAGTQTDVTIKNGKLTSTETGGDSALGLIDGNIGSTITNVLIENIEFQNTSSNNNGIVFKSSDSGTPEINVGFHKNIRVINCKFTTGRMGIEFVNNNILSNIDTITVGATTTLHTDASSGYIVVGSNVLIRNVAGTGGIDTLLNDKIFTVESESAGAIVIKYGGADVDSTGMTYTADTGDALDFRYNDIIIDGCEFIESGRQSQSKAVSLSGPGSAVSVINNVFRDNSSNGIENVGCCNSIFSHNKFINATGDILSFSGSTKMLGNIIDGNTCVGQCVGNVLFTRGYDSVMSNNVWITTENLDVQFTERCDFSNNIVINKDSSAAIFDSSPNNTIHGGVFDNSLSTGNFSTLRFNGAATTGNLAYNITLIKGTGGVTWDENDSASGNNLREFRTSRSARFSPNLVRTDIPDNATGTHGVIGTSFTNILGTNTYRAYNHYTSARVGLVVKHLTATTSNSQPPTHITCRYVGRNGNVIQGGTLTVILGTFDDYDVTPLYFEDAGGTSIGAPAFTTDGSGYPTWTWTLFTNDVFTIETEVAFCNTPADVSVTITS